MTYQHQEIESTAASVDLITNGFRVYSKQSLRDEKLFQTFQWIDQLVPLQSWATKLKMKYFNARVASTRRSLRQLANMGKPENGTILSDFQVKNSRAFGAIECAKVRVPLLWDKPSDDKFIFFHAQRYLVPDRSKRKGMIWLIQGGPGLDGSVFSQAAETFMEEFNFEYDLYVSDHRGVGRSSILECPASQVESRSACYRSVRDLWGSDGLAGFSTTGSARDILHVTKLVKQEDGGKAALYGASYGTYVSNRIMTIDSVEDNIIDLVIVDGLAGPGINFLRWEEGVDQVGKRLLSKCLESDFCKSKLGVVTQQDVEKAMMDMYDLQNDKVAFCGVERGFPKFGLMRVLSLFIQAGAPRDFIVPLIYRALRCNENDKVAMDNFDWVLGDTMNALEQAMPRAGVAVDDEHILARIMSQVVNQELSRLVHQARTPYSWDPFSEPTYGVSYELMFNIKAAELTGAPNWISHEQLVDEIYRDGRLFTAGISPNERENIVPRIQNGVYQEPLKDKWATDFKNPVLMMSADLDLQTTLEHAQHWKNKYDSKANYPSHHFTVFPHTHHIAAFNAVDKERRFICGLRVVASFLANDGSKVDTSCIENSMHKVYPFETTASADVKNLFSDDFWEGSPRSMRDDYYAMITTIIIVLAVVCCIICCICIACIACIIVCAVVGGMRKVIKV